MLPCPCSSGSSCLTMHCSGLHSEAFFAPFSNARVNLIGQSNEFFEGLWLIDDQTQGILH